MRSSTPTPPEGLRRGARRLLVLAVLVALAAAGLAAGLSSSAPAQIQPTCSETCGTPAVPARIAGTEGSMKLEAELHDNLPCPAGVDLCGKGLLHGFGTVTTTLSFTGFGPGPGDCAAVTADRALTLDSDGSTLRLSVAGVLCPQGESGGRAPGSGSGTFTVVDGTGVFAGASGGGQLSVQATGVPLPSDTAHYDGTLTFP